MEKVDFIPLGSVVLLEGGTQKLMVIARGLTIPKGDKTFYFDYGAVMYPQGLLGARMAYFNQEDIRSITFIGCNDEDNQAIVKVMNENLAKNNSLIRISADDWNAMESKE